MKILWGSAHSIICIFERIFCVFYVMKRYIFFLSALLLSACGNSGLDPSSRPDPRGGRVNGGTLRVNETDEYISLYPPRITDVVSHNIANQIYEGLVCFDAKNITRVLPCIAQSWEVDPSGLVYTFKLKKGVRFHDDPCFPDGKGREVKAQDFKYSFELICTPGADNRLFESSFKGKVKGADEFYKKIVSDKSASLEGVQALDDHTLQITLNSPISSFLYILAGVGGYVVPQEAIEKYGTSSTVGTGPFIKSSSGNSEELLLLRNPFSHRTDSLGNPLPFLDSVIISFIPDKKNELEAFKKGDIHLIFGLPAESISEMVEAQLSDFASKTPKYYLHRNSELTTQYYQFNITRKPFDNVKVRQAFSYAIDRDKIIADVLNTEAFGPGICGFTAPGISGYDITEIKGYKFSPEKARKLLAEAGYPGGRNFPPVTIELNSGGGKHVDVVEEVKKQLKAVLNVEVDFVVVPFARKLEDAKYGRAEMFRSGWVADYPDPETFLRVLYGADVPDSLELPSYPNTMRYKNPVYDSLLDAGLSAKQKAEGYAAYKQAEQLMMQDAPLLILWYGESLKMSHAYVKNFYFNSINYKDFSEVYLKKNQPETP